MSHKRVLLIDDEDDIREVVMLAFETGGDYEVMTASDGRKGIEVAIDRRPDIILLDVMMPELDGPSTLARLREGHATRDIPVIFLTAKVQVSDQRNLRNLGAAGVIAKPFDPLTLCDQVREIVSW